MENENITADMVELTEFPQLAQKYHVMGVPKTIINETHAVDGAVPESALVDLVLAAIGEEG